MRPAEIIKENLEESSSNNALIQGLIQLVIKSSSQSKKNSMAARYGKAGDPVAAIKSDLWKMAKQGFSGVQENKNESRFNLNVFMQLFRVNFQLGLYRYFSAIGTAAVVSFVLGVIVLGVFELKTLLAKRGAWKKRAENTTMVKRILIWTKLHMTSFLVVVCILTAYFAVAVLAGTIEDYLRGKKHEIR